MTILTCFIVKKKETGADFSQDTFSKKITQKNSRVAAIEIMSVYSHLIIM